MDKKTNNDNNSNLIHDLSIHAHLKLTQHPNYDIPLSQQQYYGFKRGNIIFTAQPPQRQDSGFGSSSRGSACDDCTYKITPKCEVCCGMRSPMSARRAQSFTAHFCTNVPLKKHHETVDVSSQTSPSTSMIFSKKNTKVIFKNKKYELNKHTKHHARTVHIDVYCTDSSDSEETLTSVSTDTLLDLSDVKINCKKKSKKLHILQNNSTMSSQSMLQRSPCLSSISSINKISNSSLYESSSCGLSSFMDSTTLHSGSITSSASESIQQQYKSKKNDDTTSSSDDECSETAWSFNSYNSQKNQILARRPWSIAANKNEDMGSFSDCSQSPMYRKQQTKYNSVITQVAKMASKFGPTRSLVKQDHHVGPSKNPDCTCFNCRRFFTNRHRSYSIGSETDQSDLLQLFKKHL